MSHFSETIVQKIQLAAKKLDNLTLSNEDISKFFDITMMEYERYVNYNFMGVKTVILLC